MLHIAWACLRNAGPSSVLKTGTAIERHRRSARAEVSSLGRAREGGIERGSYPLSYGGVRGISPEKIFEFNMSVEAILFAF